MVALPETVRDAGILGAGGAGFPAHVKYARAAEVFIINGAECEPLSHKDEVILATRAADIVTAAAAIREELGAKNIVLAVKGSRAGGIKDLYAGVEVRALADVYPAGDEAVLVYEVTGRRVPAAGIPPDVGVVVSNVETLLNVARALRGKPATTTWVTTAGAVAAPFTAEVPVGTPVSFLLEQAGGPRAADYVIFDGGPMMGEEVAGDTYGVRLTTGLIMVLPSDHGIVTRRRLPLEHVRTLAGSACTQCRDCTELCPRYLMGYDVTPHLSMRRFFGWDEEGEPAYFANAAGCTGCGLCELYACPMGISPRRVQMYLRSRLAEVRRAEGAGEVHADRPGRQVPAARVKKRVAVDGYDGPAPYRELEIPPRVTISTGQPYASACQVLVREGDRVEFGQPLVAPAAGDGLAVPAYASIAGRVAAVAGDHIVIDRTQIA